MTQELLELLWVLEATVSMYPELLHESREFRKQSPFCITRVIPAASMFRKWLAWGASREQAGESNLSGTNLRVLCPKRHGCLAG